MKSGTNRAVLVSELFAHDGPFVDVAEDFLAGRCTRCSLDVADDAFFLDEGFVCGDCARLVGDSG